MKTFLTSALILILIVSIGVVLILKIRSWWQADSDGHNDWTNTLAEYRGLRDRGVLSDEDDLPLSSLPVDADKGSSTASFNAGYDA